MQVKEGRREGGREQGRIGGVRSGHCPNAKASFV